MEGTGSLERNFPIKDVVISGCLMLCKPPKYLSMTLHDHSRKAGRYNIAQPISLNLYKENTKNYKVMRLK